MGSALVTGLVLAGGEGRRFGQDSKLLADLAGRPVLTRALDAMHGAGLAEVACVLGADRDRVRRRIDFSGVTTVECPDWSLGQSASLRAGISALDQSDAIVLTLGDQPFISAEAIKRVVASTGEAEAAQATYDGIPGHPVLFTKSLFARLKDIEGDRGARDLLSNVSLELVACDQLGSPIDVDMPSDLAAAERLFYS